jgi:protease-4
MAKKLTGDIDLDTNLDVTNADLQNTMASILLADILKERRSDRRWRFFKRFMIAAVFIGGTVFYAVFYANALGMKINIFPEFNREPELAIVRISGTIGEKATSADELIPTIRRAFSSKRTKAVVLQIDSPGGAPGDAERIGKFVREMRMNSEKPVHAVITGIGASAAFMIAMEADSIYAGRYSLVGSIGAVISTWDVHRLMERIEVQQRTFASGELKSMLNPFTPPSKEGDAKAQELVDGLGGMFAEDLFSARAAKLKRGVDYATGEVWNGVVARDIGLVDEIGTVETVQGRYGLSKVRVYRPRDQFSLIQMVGDWAREVGDVLPFTPGTLGYTLR